MSRATAWSISADSIPSASASRKACAVTSDCSTGAALAAERGRPPVASCSFHAHVTAARRTPDPETFGRVKVRVEHRLGLGPGLNAAVVVLQTLHVLDQPRRASV